MTAEESEFNKTKWRRIRRVKKWLRPLPRRANIHRYPILKFFSEAARKRIYIWSFRVENAVPAIYAGSILTLMPIYGIQVPLAFLLALVLRANLPILVGLQVVSNPLTVLPIWYAAYQIGRIFLGFVGIQVDPLNHQEVRLLLDNFIHGAWGNKFDNIAMVFGVTNLGALVMGTFFGLIGSVIYRIVANRTAASYALLRAKMNDHKSKPGASASSKDSIND
ncbi:DUF2062 domain-containing protein [Coraliomargarita sp. SDUM461004]|uniref:DUF2062 domain-containing protein n=1 Tax=Thalassobacterium sedimentorum TaxID=3041258 RepID=A0ABU1AM78_9BACT|nr:DUF2062 domain-containing protein [Coraliomargarita sp. SDUM461004]MDQ8194708.1 DUF2062 domain-containing protein [Coraliomargarita sp. SDUM461004]